MKKIKYRFQSTEGEQTLTEKSLGYSEANVEIARQEAYNGVYTIEDDGQPDPEDVPSQLDTIEAQLAYTALMTNTLLEV